jgi:hypothetical protein
MIAAARLSLSSDPANNQFRSSMCPQLYLIFYRIIIYGYSAVLEILSQCYPAPETVIQHFGHNRLSL